MHVNNRLILSAVWAIRGISAVPIPQGGSAGESERKTAGKYGIGGAVIGVIAAAGVTAGLRSHSKVEKNWAGRDAFYSNPDLVDCVFHHLGLPQTAEAPILVEDDSWNDAGYQCKEAGWTTDLEMPDNTVRVIVLPTRAQLDEKARVRALEDEVERLRRSSGEGEGNLDDPWQFSLGKPISPDWFINKAKNGVNNLGSLGAKVMAATKSPHSHAGPAWLPKLGGVPVTLRLPV
ncbi:MAG: hypothetical protein M1816_006585 [Peltula sp. TS41687]|nr:MAG: hypothetical protein M1816_006585 [Peltula sp. TS41687]